MDFITIDFETAKYSRESACSVGLVKYQKGKPVDTFYSLIRPPVLYIRPDFTAIHGLTADDVKDAPAFSEIWESNILPFIGTLPLAAHNASFDMGVLKAVINWYELPSFSFNYFCTVAMSRAVWPELPSHSLPKLAAKFGINYNAHNALADAQVCGDIICMAAQKMGVKKVKTLLSNIEIEMRTF